MPVGPGKYRMVRTKSGAELRLHFGPRGVDEAKNMDTGAVHSPKDFAADRKKKQRDEFRKRVKGGLSD